MGVPVNLKIKSLKPKLVFILGHDEKPFFLKIALKSFAYFHHCKTLLCLTLLVEIRKEIQQDVLLKM